MYLLVMGKVITNYKKNRFSVPLVFFLNSQSNKKKCFSSFNMLRFMSKTKIYYKNIKNISFSFYYFGIISFCFINIQMHHIANKYPLI